MLTLTIFNTLGEWMSVCPKIFMDTVLNSNHIVMADVMVIALWWQMLLPHNVVVLCGRWKATVENVMALCIEQVADVIATGGSWNSHLRVDYILSSEVLNRTSSYV